MKKRYKPKKWFTYTRLGLIFVVIFALSKTTNVVYSSITAENNNEAKALEHKVIDENKEDIYIEENSVLKKYLSMPEKGFEVSINNNKYEVSSSDYNLLVAVVAAESNRYMDDVLAVSSVILNRSDLSGKSPIDVITSRGQFSGYLDGYYLRYLNEDGTLTPNTTMVQEVVSDALNGVRNNHYYSFRSWGSDFYSDNYIAEGGNRYN